MWHPNFGHPVLNFLAWLIVLGVVLLIVWWVLAFLGDVFTAPPARIRDLVPQHYKFRIG